MGKGRWFAWLLLLVMIFAGCGTEAEVVTSEITFEEESESQPESEVVEVESESEPLRVPVPFETVCYRVGGRRELLTEDPVLLRSVEDIQTITWGKEAFLWDYEKQANENWEDVDFFSMEDLGKEQFDEAFFEKHDLFLIPTMTGSGMYTVRVTDLLYVPATDSYELNYQSENRYWAVDEGTGAWLMMVTVEKGIFQQNGENALPEVRGTYMNIPYREEGYTQDGRHGVSMEMTFDQGELYPLTDGETGEYGISVYHYDEGKSTKICYFENGFTPAPAAVEQEITLADGRTVNVGYNEEGAWIWVDFRHESGCYWAVNQGVDPVRSRVLLPCILRAQIGPKNQ